MQVFPLCRPDGRTGGLVDVNLVVYTELTGAGEEEEEVSLPFFSPLIVVSLPRFFAPPNPLRVARI